MKKIIVFSLLLLFSFITNAQIVAEGDEGDEAEIFEIVEQSPVYEGGDEARQRFIAKNIVYPDSAIKYQKQGTIIVEFVVEVDSSLSHVRAVKSFDDYCAEEAIRVVRMMRWVPGRQKGEAVRVKIRMPIRFRLT